MRQCSRDSSAPMMQSFAPIGLLCLHSELLKRVVSALTTLWFADCSIESTVLQLRR